MKKLVIIVTVLSFAVADKPKSRSKREAYALPSGAELVVGSVQTTFRCPEMGQGYFADMDNDCKIFHVCDTPPGDGADTFQYSFICGNLTVFNQFTFTCTYPEDSIPCSESASLYYLNEDIRRGDPEELFHDDADRQKAAALIKPGAGGGRILAVIIATDTDQPPAPPRRTG